jgi:hypothetical protein
MARPFTPKVLTANDLLSGDVVYLTPEGGWSRQHREAELLQDAALAELRLLDAEARGHEIVGAYLADARPGRDGPEPVHPRERLRADGLPADARGRAPAA